MAKTVLETLETLATDEFVRTTARQLAATEGAVSGALAAACAVLLDRLAGLTSDASVMSRVAALVEPPREAVGASIARMDAMGYVPPPVPTPGAPSVATRLGRGTALLNIVVGTHLQAFVEALARHAELTTTSSRAVIGHAAPLVLRALGMRLGDPSSDAVRLAPAAGKLVDLLDRERDTFSRGAPASISSALSGIVPQVVPATVVDQPADDPADALSETSGEDAAPVTKPAPVAIAAGRLDALKGTAAAVLSEMEGTSLDLRMLAGVLTALTLLWWLFLPGFYATYSLRVDPAFAPDAGGPRRPAIDTAPAGSVGPGTASGGTFSSSTSTTPSSIGPGGAVTGLLRLIKRTLPSNKQIDYAEEGIEGRMIALIEDRGRPLERTQWFEFDRLNFQTGSSNLTVESRAQVQNLADILSAYPAVKIKIGGYTDNVGDPQANQRLSEARAQRVMTELITLGVNALRLEAEGYGDQHPVADNSTSEGRAKNRRTAVRITER